MKLYNLKDYNEQVSFVQVVIQGFGKYQGLFFLYDLLEFSLIEIDDMLVQDFVICSVKILFVFIGDEILQDVLQQWVCVVFVFLVLVSKVQEDVGCLELFYGFMLVFKDFGGCFMVQMLIYIVGDKLVIIFIVIFGDIGVVVVYVFYGLLNVKVVIFYLCGKISLLQEKLFCIFGGNIEIVVIDGDFDVCQVLVKQVFDDEELKVMLGFNLVNFINISCLLVQICYYFEVVVQLLQEVCNQLVIFVLSGNFGDLIVGLLVKLLGLLIKCFIVVINVNDIVLCYLQGGEWVLKVIQVMLFNVMDVSQLNNWLCVEELFCCKIWCFSELGYVVVDDEIIKVVMCELKVIGYIFELYVVIVWCVLCDQLQLGEYGLFFGIVYLVKFKESVEEILQEILLLLKELVDCVDLLLLFYNLLVDFVVLCKLMMG